MLSPNTAVALNVHGVDIAIWSRARRRTVYCIMGCETGLITSVWARCCCWRSIYNMSQSITVSTTYQHTRTHTLIILTVILLCKCTHTCAHTQNVLPAWKTKLESFNLLWRQSLPPLSDLTCTPLIARMMNYSTSQQHSCDIFTRVVYKHRCANVISGFTGRMSREGSLLFALMNHAVT